MLLEKAKYSGKTIACGGLFSKNYYNFIVDDNDVLEQNIKICDFILPWGKMSHEDQILTVQRCMNN